MTLRHPFQLLSLCHWGSSPFPWNPWVISVLSSLCDLTQRGCNVSSCFRTENDFFSRFLLRVQPRPLELAVSLKFFGKKCLQRSRPDVLCYRVALAILSISSLRATPHQVLQPFHCSLQLSQLGTSRRKDLSEQSFCSFRRQGVPSFVQTPPGFQSFSRARAHKDVERLSLHEDHHHCEQLICQPSLSAQRHQDFCRCVRFCHRCRFSFHGPLQDISRSRMYAHDEVLCASCPRQEFTFRVLQWWRLTKAFRVQQGWIGSCWMGLFSDPRQLPLRYHVCKVCAQFAYTVYDDNLFPTTNELKRKGLPQGLIKTNIYK